MTLSITDHFLQWPFQRLNLFDIVSSPGPFTFPIPKYGNFEFDLALQGILQYPMD